MIRYVSRFSYLRNLEVWSISRLRFSYPLAVTNLWGDSSRSFSFVNATHAWSTSILFSSSLPFRQFVSANRLGVSYEFREPLPPECSYVRFASGWLTTAFLLVSYWSENGDSLIYATLTPLVMVRNTKNRFRAVSQPHSALVWHAWQARCCFSITTVFADIYKEKPTFIDIQRKEYQ